MLRTHVELQTIRTHQVEIIYAILLFKLVSARYAFMPKFFGQDSDVVIDTDKPMPHYHPVHYPVYRIIPRVAHSSNTQFAFKELPKTTTPPTTTTPAPIYSKDEFPSDLLEIAQDKLGIQSLDEIPSVSELGELLGTESTQETIKYIRQLIATDEGIALIRAYIESSDYTDSTGTTTVATTPILEILNLPASQPSFFERLSSYLNIFDLFSTNTLSQQVEQLTSRRQNHAVNSGSPHQLKPILVRNPLPYHYPIPIRPVVIYQPRKTHKHAQHSSLNSLQSAVHLNTPKHMMTQLEISSKPAKKLTKTSTEQPQQKHLHDLAMRVSKFPLTNDRDAFDAQYVATIEKAFEQDEDLKKLLSSTETLK